MCNDYKKHRESVLFDLERALLPATQPLVENIYQQHNRKNQKNIFQRIHRFVLK
jgi:hypothetical protein